MSSKPKEPQSTSDSSDRSPLPFEPAKSRKQTERKAEAKTAKKAPATAVKSKETDKSSRSDRQTATTGIPEVVSRRMVKRMAAFCGVPTFLGMASFVVSYFLVINNIFPVPTYAVLFVSLGFFGLGVLGLSYGALSASWDEGQDGSRLGWTEFTTNWGRMTGAWKETREARKSSGKS